MKVMHKKYTEEAVKIEQQRIEMLQCQIDLVKAGKGFTCSGVTEKQQIMAWEREIKKAENFIRKIERTQKLAKVWATLGR